MGMDPITLGLAMGGATMASSLMSGLGSSRQQQANAEAQQAQAQQLREQTKIQREQGQIEAEAIDKQRAQLRQRYEAQQAANRARLGAANVDMSSGSALAVADGNAQAYASDVGESFYMRALKQAETRNAINASLQQANVLDSNASYQKRTASNLAPTLLGAALSGAGSFMTGYSFGGRLSGK